MEIDIPNHDYGRQILEHGGRRNFCVRYFRLQADLFNIRHLRWNIPIINYDTRNPILTHKTGGQEGEVKAQLEEDGVAWRGTVAFTALMYAASIKQPWCDNFLGGIRR